MSNVKLLTDVSFQFSAVHNIDRDSAELNQEGQLQSTKSFSGKRNFNPGLNKANQEVHIYSENTKTKFFTASCE